MISIDSTLGTCISCNVEGKPGDGSSQGTCGNGQKCHIDGSCSLCSSTAGDLAGTDTEPHSGCTKLNPRCNDGTDECQCDTTSPTKCEAEVATTCAMADTKGVCMCGGDEACSGTTPMCDVATDPASCIGCTNDAGTQGDAKSQGSCTSASLMCLDDGSCQCRKDMVGGLPGDAMDAGTCTDAGKLCLADGTCKCQKDATGTDGDGDGTSQGTCMDKQACNSDGSCSTCNVDGNPGDGKTQGTCPDGLRRSAEGTCLCKK